MMLSLQPLLELMLAILIAVGIPSAAYIMHLRDNRRRAAGTPVIKVQTYALVARIHNNRDVDRRIERVIHILTEDFSIES